MSYWLAIDKEEQEFITIYKEKPERGNSGLWKGNSCGLLDKKEFPELTWENDPVEIEIKQLYET